MLLADLIDAVNMLRWENAAMNRRKGQPKPPPPKPVPRPGVKQKGQRIGRGAIPVSRFDEWWRSKAQEAKTATR
ncbi:hypothetical protein [Bifidobacterium simiiventris]|uniref:hypothetical protein n=1 Tax=Bifidobacterium simiiventris TaxID=2834434 RepID=UPI001C59351A|nr:hypothetical protein [Bifidobacterium simiiventris]MBW3077687.1 hypothetical protein [Bifidobacterium simiiventris]